MVDRWYGSRIGCLWSLYILCPNNGSVPVFLCSFAANVICIVCGEHGIDSPHICCLGRNFSRQGMNTPLLKAFILTSRLFSDPTDMCISLYGYSKFARLCNAQNIPTLHGLLWNIHHNVVLCAGVCR